MGTDSLKPENFDYSQVTKEQQSTLIYCAGQIQKSKDAIAKNILEIGGMLATAQQQLSKSKEGTFLAWVESECGFSKSTAYRLLKVHLVFGNFPNVGKIEDAALYRLSENEVPKKAVSEAKKLAEKGRNITSEQARKLIKKYSPSDQGKPGGESPSSSKMSPVPSGPASGGAAGSDGGTDSGSRQEDAPRTLRKGKEVPGDLGKCPNCAGTKWIEDEEGIVCKKCGQPHGEPAGGVDEDRVKTAVSILFKSAEATMRAADDLNHICPNENHGEVIRLCKQIMAMSKEWK